MKIIHIIVIFVLMAATCLMPVACKPGTTQVPQQDVSAEESAKEMQLNSIEDDASFNQQSDNKMHIPVVIAIAFSALLLVGLFVWSVRFLLKKRGNNASKRNLKRHYDNEPVAITRGASTASNNELKTLIAKSMQEINGKISQINAAIASQQRASSRMLEYKNEVSGLTQNKQALEAKLALAENKLLSIEAEWTEKLQRAHKQHEEAILSLRNEKEVLIAQHNEAMDSNNEAAKRAMEEMQSAHATELDEVKRMYSDAMNKYWPESLFHENLLITIIESLNNSITGGNSSRQEILFFGDLQRLAASVGSDNFKNICIDAGSSFYKMAYSSDQWQQSLGVNQNQFAEWMNLHLPSPFKIYVVESGREYDRRYHEKSGAGIIIKKPMSFLMLSDEEASIVYKKAVVET